MIAQSFKVSFPRKPQVKQLPLFSAQAAPERKHGEGKGKKYFILTLAACSVKHCSLAEPLVCAAPRNSALCEVLGAPGGVRESQEQLLAFHWVHGTCRRVPGSHSSLQGCSHLSILPQIHPPEVGNDPLLSPREGHSAPEGCAAIWGVQMS